MNRIRELRQEKGWTQTQLGARVGMAKTTISGYEKGDHQVDPEMICKLCDLFGCTADYLLGRSLSPAPVMSSQDALVLEAYHALPDELRDAVDRILEPYRGGVRKKKDA
jgi:transcriptional regulator with XRE-family HTH domain